MPHITANQVFRITSLSPDTITAKLATPEARAMNRDMARAMEALDMMPTATRENRTAHADAVDRFMELADRYDVLIYGPVARYRG